MQLDEQDSLWSVPLVLAATPIGNLGDATDRLRRLIATADIIACEDTRRTRHLMSALGLKTTASLVSLHEHNEASRSAELVEQARTGQKILVVSDAGMPAVSDPGLRLVRAAINAGINVTVAPGASAVTTALALSGLDTQQFVFAGFVPRKLTDRQKLLRRLEQEDYTTVLFESPHRIAATVAEFSSHLGAQRSAAVARELTKKYEEVLRGELGELSQILQERSETGLKGEFVLLISGAEPHAAMSQEELVAEVLSRAEQGERLKTAAKAVGASYGVSSNELYDLAIQQRKK